MGDVLDHDLLLDLAQDHYPEDGQSLDLFQEDDLSLDLFQEDEPSLDQFQEDEPSQDLFPDAILDLVLYLGDQNLAQLLLALSLDLNLQKQSHLRNDPSLDQPPLVAQSLALNLEAPVDHLHKHVMRNVPHQVVPSLQWEMAEKRVTEKSHDQDLDLDHDPALRAKRDVLNRVDYIFNVMDGAFNMGCT